MLRGSRWGCDSWTTQSPSALARTTPHMGIAPPSSASRFSDHKAAHLSAAGWHKPGRHFQSAQPIRHGFKSTCCPFAAVQMEASQSHSALDLICYFNLILEMVQGADLDVSLQKHNAKWCYEPCFSVEETKGLSYSAPAVKRESSACWAPAAAPL